MKRFFAFLLIGFCSTASLAQKNYKSVLLMNGTAHLGTGEVINNSLIGIKNNKLVLVANALTTTPNLSEYDTVIKIQGKHVYPGFIAMDVTLGLVEIEAVRATRDDNETGDFQPGVRTVIAYNTDSKVIPTVRSNGVLLAQVTPRGGIISGQSAVMKLQGWNWEDAVQNADEGIHLNWPSYMNRGGWWAEPGETKANDKYTEQLKKISDYFILAKAYAEDPDALMDVELEAMKGLFNGKKRLYIHAQFVKEITDAVRFTKEMGISHLAIVGGYDSWRVADLLRENRVTVVVRRPHELPIRPEDDIDLPFKIPFLLQKEGVQFTLSVAGDQEAAQSRNLPFFAGTTVAYGLFKEEALKAITLTPAKILGIEKQVGSLEPGKDATLFVSEGDALDMRTNKVIMAWIQGENVDLGNHQIELYEKYSEKYGHK